MRNWLLVAILVSSLFLMAVLQPATAADIPVQGAGGEEPLATAITNCQTINSPGVYELQNNITASSSPCILITAFSVILDGKGFTITGPGSGIGVVGYGLWAPTIQNINIKNFATGIYLDGSWGANIQDVSVTANKIGVWIQTGGGALTRVTANQNNQYGFYIIGSSIPVTDSTAIGNGIYDFYTTGLNNVANFKIDPNTFISFTAGNVALKSGTSPGNEPLPTLGKYITAASLATGATLTLNISYTDEDVANAGIINENALKMARYDGTWYTNPAVFATSYGVDTTNNVVYASMTNPSGTYGPLGTSGQITSCTNITSSGAYKLAQNIAGNQSKGRCIDMQADDVALDCAGYTMNGPNTFSYYSYGVYAEGRHNITVANCYITAYSYGISLTSASNNILANNTINSNGNGVSLYLSNDNTLTNNTASTNTYGLMVYFSNGNKLINNTAKSNGLPSGIGMGISIRGSNNSIITGNIADSNKAVGIIIYDNSNYNNITNNSASSNGVQYIGQGITLDMKSTHNIVINNTANSNTYNGVMLTMDSHYNTLTDNTANSNGESGIFVTGKENAIINNKLNSNKYGVHLSSASNNTIQSNSISSNTNSGIYVDVGTTQNKIISNTMSGSITGISISGANNNISNNNIYTPIIINERTGMIISGAGATGNNINNNKIYTGSCEHNGILIDGANSNTLTGNTIDADRICSGSCGYCGSVAVKKGITVQNANYNNLISNVVQKNLYEAVKLQNANFTTIQSQNAQQGIYQGAIGLRLDASNNNNIIGGTFSGGAAYGYASSGIILSNSNNNNITGAFGSGYRGMYLASSNNNLIKNSIALGSYESNYQPPHGIEIVNSVGNALLDNKVSSGTANSARLSLSNANNTIVNNLTWYDAGGQGSYAAKVMNSYYNTLEKIQLWGENMGYGAVYGIYAENSNGNTFRDEVIDPWKSGNPIYAIYLKNSADNIIENNKWYPYFSDYALAIYGGQNNIVRNNSLTSGYATFSGHIGLVLTNTINNQIYNNNFTRFCYAVLLSNADGNTFQNNLLRNATTYTYDNQVKSCPTPTQAGTGILTKDGSTDNTFTQNNILQNEKKGVWLYESAPIPINAVVSYNIIVGVNDSSVGVQKDNVIQTTVANNDISNCAVGVNASSTSQDPISYNTFSNGIEGIRFKSVTNSQVDHNTFTNVVKPIVLEGTSGNTFTANTGTGNGIAITGQTSADTFTNNNVGELTPKTVTCGQTLTTSTKLANSISCAGNGLTLSGNNIFIECNGKALTGIRNPTTQQLRGTGVTVNGNNDMVDGCNITGFALAVDLGANPNVMSNDNLSKNAKGVSFVEYLKQTFANIDWDP